jgi:hypothetical protein
LVATIQFLLGTTAILRIYHRSRRRWSETGKLERLPAAVTAPELLPGLAGDSAVGKVHTGVDAIGHAKAKSAGQLQREAKYQQGQ